MTIFVIALVLYGVWQYVNATKPVEGGPTKTVVRAAHAGVNKDEICNGIEAKIETKNGEGYKAALFQKEELMDRNGEKVRGFCILTVQKVKRS